MNKEKWNAAKKLVAERDEYTCQMCLGEATDVHHRIVRGIGGTSDDKVNYSPANLISVCRECHDDIHAEPEQSYEDGYLVRKGEDPASKPVLITPDLTVWLNKDGSREILSQEMLF